MRRRYASLRIGGKNKTQAALMAGYSPSTARKNDLEKPGGLGSQTIRHELAKRGIDEDFIVGNLKLGIEDAVKPRAQRQIRDLSAHIELIAHLTRLLGYRNR